MYITVFLLHVGQLTITFLLDGQKKKNVETFCIGGNVDFIRVWEKCGEVFQKLLEFMQKGM